jgi:O-antigen ligase
VYSLLRLGETAARSADVAGALWRHALSTRISPHFPDVNAMGSLFALGTVGWSVVAIAKGLSRWQRTGAVVGTLIAGAALWLTGSRAAIAPAALTFLLTWWYVRRPSWTTLAAALALVAAAGITLFVATRDTVLRPRAPPEEAMSVRVEFALAGLRMAADHPWLGVGLGEFSRYSPQFISQALAARFPAAAYGENAHNQLIQVLGELGVIGFAAFVWYWIRVLGPAIRRLGSGEGGPWLAAGTAGLCAFHLSALFGHPFLTPYVVLCVFVSVGVVAGLSPEANTPTLKS